MKLIKRRQGLNNKQEKDNYKHQKLINVKNQT